MTSWEQEGERKRERGKEREKGGKKPVEKKSANNFQVHFDFSEPNKAILR